MNRMRSIIVVTGKTWEEHLNGGYRTRQGALLANLLKMDVFDSVIHVIEPGFMAKPSFRIIENANSTVEVIEVVLPNRFPELFFRLFGPAVMKRNYRMHPKLKSVLADSMVEAIWSYSTTAGILFRSLTDAKFLYDAIDYRANDPNLSLLSRWIYRHEIGLAYRFADMMTCNSEYAFQQHSRQRKKDCFLIRNGVDPERFKPFRQVHKNGKVLFIGAISHWTDFQLLKSLFKALPSVQFDFYGIVQSAEEELNALKQFPNFAWYGKIPSDKVPELIPGYSVGLVPYDSKITQQTMGDSMKIFEYLAAGVPVVSTPFQQQLEVKFEGLVKLSSNEDDFIRMVAGLLGNPVDTAWQLAAWEFVLRNTWEKRIREALDSI